MTDKITHGKIIKSLHHMVRVMVRKHPKINPQSLHLDVLTSVTAALVEQNPVLCKTFSDYWNETINKKNND